VYANPVDLQGDRISTPTSMGTAQTFILLRYLGGTAHCVVPYVIGKKLPGAKRAIRRSDCSVGRVRRSFSLFVPKGHVMSERPRAHTRHPAGTKVSLVVSKGRRR